MSGDGAGDAELVETIATACRVMADHGLVENILGHVSARVGEDRLLLRCRGPQEGGLARTTADDVREVGFDGTGDTGAWHVPNELPIHVETLRARGDVTAVVHAHPPAVVVHSLLDRPLVPLYGAYDIPGARLAADGVPTWPRSVLISSAELGRAVAAALGEAPVLVLRGHGLVSVAGGDPATAVQQAVVQALAVDTLARMSLAVLGAGGVPAPIGDDDLAALPDLGPGFNVATMWRHLVARLGEPD